MQSDRRRLSRNVQTARAPEGHSLDPNAKSITDSYYFGGGSKDSIAIPDMKKLVL
jgi:hypothetical protein